VVRDGLRGAVRLLPSPGRARRRDRRRDQGQRLPRPQARADLDRGGGGADRAQPRRGSGARRFGAGWRRVVADPGGGAIVEATSIGLLRDPEGLRETSAATGVHVVMGGSDYYQPYHPEQVAGLSVEDITAEIVRDITEGAGGSGVRAGIIGEVGLGWPHHPDEIKALRASAVAQQETGAALLIHPGRNPASPLAAIAIVREARGDPGRTIMSHIDRTLFSGADMRELAETGCTLEFDLFGQESSYYAHGPIDMPNDAVRIDHLIRLIGQGFRDRLVIAQDICHKRGLKAYGGDGYSHILENVVPVMKRKGMGQDDIDAILVHNPARILAFQ
ncbi:MAG: hypothetical protein IIA41_07210, partial [SAR324 cluster bacterium]|nr:hypothetical protein [SAR324 cluster bacterium]